MRRFRDRSEAGRLLADKLRHELADALVLGLARGGVPVAHEVARALGASLDVFVVQKLGTPGQPELAMGAVTSGGARVLNSVVVRELAIRDNTIDEVAAREMRELERREQLYRGGRLTPVTERAIILVDDGLATGTSMRAAVTALKTQQPARLVVAVPVGAADSCAAIGREVDALVCVHTPTSFYAVGQWYDDFSQVSDVEVRELLARKDERL